MYNIASSLLYLKTYINDARSHVPQTPDFRLIVLFLDHVANTQMNSDFRQEVDEICTLLGHYAASSGDSIRIFFLRFLDPEDGTR